MTLPLLPPKRTRGREGPSHTPGSKPCSYERLRQLRTVHALERPRPVLLEQREVKAIRGAGPGEFPGGRPPDIAPSVPVKAGAVPRVNPRELVGVQLDPDRVRLGETRNRERRQRVPVVKFFALPVHMDR